MASRKSVYVLLLLTLIAFKVSSVAIHIYLHHGEGYEHEEPCELCEHAIYNQLSEFSTTTEFPIFENNRKPDYDQPKNKYDGAFITPFFESTLVVRPPPSSI